MTVVAPAPIAPVVPSRVVAPPVVLPFTEQDSAALTTLLTTPGRIDVPMSPELARSVVAGFTSLSNLPHFNQVWDERTRHDIQTHNYTRREIIGMINQIVIATDSPSEFVTRANLVIARISTLTDQERSEVRSNLSRAGFSAQDANTLELMFFESSRNGLEFRQFFSVPELSSKISQDLSQSQSRVLNYARQMVRNASLQVSLRDTYLSALDGIFPVRSPQSEIDRFHGVIQMYQSYFQAALRTHPSDRSRIEENYLHIFYGPSTPEQEGPGATVCLVDQIQRNRVLSVDQKQQLISSIESILSRTAPVATRSVAPTAVITPQPPATNT